MTLKNWMTSVVLVVGLASLPASAAVLQQVFFDDFSGDLSQWNLSLLADNSASISNGQLVIDASTTGSNRGFILTNYEVPSSADLLPLVGDNEVFMRVSFDVISSNSVPAGELVFGKTPTGLGAGQLNGLETASPLASNSPTGLGHAHGDFSNNSANDGPIGSGLNGTSHQSPIGKTVSVEWVSQPQGIPQSTRRIDVYFDDVLEFSLDDVADADRPSFQSGAVGFYLLLNRDFTIDNFRVEIVPEPATFSLLALGLVGVLRKRRIW